MKIPKSDNKFLEIARKNISINCEKKVEKVLNLIKKLDKKQKNNDYVSGRDLLVIGCILIGSVGEVIDDSKMSLDAHKELKQLYDKITKDEEQLAMKGKKNEL
jgi:hypothetical protein